MSENLAHALAGAGGSVVAMSLTYPLISISTRAQVETKKNPGETTWTAVTKCLQEEGISGLYAGLNSSLLGIAVTNGVYYFFFEYSREALNTMKVKAGKPTGSGMSTGESMLAGLFAGAITTIATNPLWTINTRQTVRASPDDPEAKPATGQEAAKLGSKAVAAGNRPVAVKKLGMLETARMIYEKDGLKAFWNGLGPALILVINPILQYTLFEQLRSRLAQQRKLGDLDFFWLGAISKLAATGSTYPYITVKSRMQSGQKEGMAYRNAWHGVMSIVQKEGVAGLYRGIGSKLTQSVLTAAFLFMMKERLFESSKTLLGIKSK